MLSMLGKTFSTQHFEIFLFLVQKMGFHTNSLTMRKTSKICEIFHTHKTKNKNIHNFQFLLTEFATSIIHFFSIFYPELYINKKCFKRETDVPPSPRDFQGQGHQNLIKI